MEQNSDKRSPKIPLFVAQTISDVSALAGISPRLWRWAMNDSTNNKANSVVAANSAGLILAAGAACRSLVRDGDRALIFSKQHLLETKALAMGDELFNWHKAWSMKSAFELNSYSCNWHSREAAA